MRCIMRDIKSLSIPELREVIELDAHLHVMELSIALNKCCDLRGECDTIGYKEH